MSLTVIKPNTPFVLSETQLLSAEQLKRLSLLYQPLIGPQAFSLYLTLNSLSMSHQELTLTHHLLLQILQVKVDDLITWRQKLEAVGLLSVYELEEEAALLYVIHKPLSARQFFNDGIINVFLNLKIGNVDYQMIKQCFAQPSYDGIGVNMTKPFNEVFDTTVLARHSQSVETGIATREPLGVTLESSFNLELLLTLCQQFGLDDKILSDKLVDQLNKIAFLYKLDEHELARLIFDAIDVDGFVNMELFRKLAKQYFQFINKGKPVEMVEKQNSDKLKPDATKAIEGSKNRDELLIHFLTETNPIDFLKLKSHQKDPVPADRQLVEWLLVDQQFPPGVVNVLVDYVLKVSDGRLPKAFVEKIAGEWSRKNITDTEKAIKQVKTAIKAKDKREQNQSQPQARTSYQASRKPIREEKVPDWLNQQTQSQADSLSDDDLAKIEKMKQLQQQFLTR